MLWKTPGTYDPRKQGKLGPACTALRCVLCVAASVAADALCGVRLLRLLSLCVGDVCVYRAVLCFCSPSLQLSEAAVAMDQHTPPAAAAGEDEATMMHGRCGMLEARCREAKGDKCLLSPCSDVPLPLSIRVPGVESPLVSKPGPKSRGHVSISIGAPPANAGRVQLLTQQEALLVHGDDAAKFHALSHGLSVRSAAFSPCQWVLAKSSVALHANYESSNRLKYELALHERVAALPLAAAEQELGVAARPGSVADIESDKKGGSNNPTVQPHMRYLRDGRLALILGDTLGLTLRECMQRQAAILLAPGKARAVVGAKVMSSHSGKLARPPIIASLSVFTVQTAVSMTLVIALKLHRLHAMSLVHKALHPDTIQLNTESRDVRFLDLTASSLLLKNKADSDMNIKLQLASSWLYLSPEYDTHT